LRKLVKFNIFIEPYLTT